MSTSRGRRTLIPSKKRRNPQTMLLSKRSPPLYIHKRPRHVVRTWLRNCDSRGNASSTRELQHFHSTPCCNPVTLNTIIVVRRKDNEMLVPEERKWVAQLRPLWLPSTLQNRPKLDSTSHCQKIKMIPSFRRDGDSQLQAFPRKTVAIFKEAMHFTIHTCETLLSSQSQHLSNSDTYEARTFW